MLKSGGCGGCGGGCGGSFIQNNVSFKEKVMQSKEKAPVRPSVDLLKHNLARIKFKDDNRLKSDH